MKTLSAEGRPPLWNPMELESQSLARKMELPLELLGARYQQTVKKRV
jgi:hypothetical protein